MVFSSVQYLLLLAGTLAVLAILKSSRSQKVFLVAVSYYFYSFWDYRFTALLGGLTVATFAFSDRIHHAETAKARKGWLAASVTVSLATLSYFKYCNFFIENANFALARLGIHLSTLPIILPVGISFIVFEVISYAVDVYRRDADYERNFLDFALLVAYFPHLIAGPILKPKAFLPQLNKRLEPSWDGIAAGSQVFLLGLCKKLLIADRVAPFVDGVFRHPLAYSSGTVWLGVIAYALQIYCDFSGYTDMAIGSAQCMGLHLPDNFNRPYLSTNITEFWRRWHISLSTWLREYLYIPLGGNRKGKLRQYLNLAVVMLLGGLWHGASWNFVLWGGLHGVGLAVHKAYTEYVGSSVRNNLAVRLASWLATLLFVLVAWVPFRSATWSGTMAIFSRLLALDGGAGIVWVGTAFLIAFPLYVAADYFSARFRTNFRYNLGDFRVKVAVAFVLLGLLFMKPTASAPFIYFQF